MTDARATLAAVFTAPKEKLSKPERENLEQDHDILSIKRNIVDDFSDQQWQVLVNELGANLAGCLDTRIPDILLNAWKTTNELARYCDSRKYPPADSVLVPLAKHVIESEHHPAIEIFIREKRIGKIPFTIKLKLKLEGFLLTVQNCRIKAISTGTCIATGKIELKDLTIAEVESDKITLPGRIDLGDGVAIV